jgi:N-acetylmuramoyl-L-alanine amidase
MRISTHILLTLSLSILPLLGFRYSGDKGRKNVDTNQQEPVSNHLKKVVIDAGHGGNDSGCHHGKNQEKTNTLAIALKLGEKIKDNYPNIEVIYTRDHDVFIPLNRRAEIANKAKADLFISIHCNSTDEGSSASGSETYVLGLHRKGDNLNVMKRENSSILLEDDYEKTYNGFDPNSNESYILFSMVQTTYLNKSIQFAKLVEQNLKTDTERKSKGVRQAGFLVLRETAMPSILIETGFLNNETDGAFISSDEGQNTIANSIFNAFSTYKNETEAGASSNNLTEEVKPHSPKIKTPQSANTSPPVHGAHQNNKGVAIDKSKTQYKILLLATENPQNLEQGRWSKVNNVQVLKENNKYRYFCGDADSYDDAYDLIKKYRALGFEHATILEFRNGKQVIN